MIRSMFTCVLTFRVQRVQLFACTSLHMQLSLSAPHVQ